MLLIHCPYCEEERPELEFRHAGEAHIARPDPITDISDEEFEAYFFIRDNPKGIVFERWRHIHGCARFFNAARDTVSDKFLTTYRAGEPKPDLKEGTDLSSPAAYANREPAALNAKTPARKRASAKSAKAPTAKPARAGSAASAKAVKATTKKSTTNKPAAKDATARKPAAKKATVKKPTVRKAASKKAKD